MKRALLALIAVCLGAVFFLLAGRSGTYARPEPGEITIGMNLSAVTYWSRELPFVDVAKASMPWITQNCRDVPGGKNPWDTGMLEHIPLDADGYPLSLPVEVEGAEAPQAVAALMCRTGDGRYPAGRYVCLYDGRGEIVFSLDALVHNSRPGRIELDVTPTSAGILMKVLRSEKGNHVRNIRVLMPGFDEGGGSQTFNPAFVKRLEPFKVIRFMEWQRTNDSCVQDWDRRTTPSSHTQAGRQGVAIEHMIELCNLLGADPWFCIPHQASEDYVRRFARLVRDRLHPGRKVYVEYSNEVWNRMFSQYAWVESHGDPALSHARKYAARAGKAFALWHEEFGDGKARIVRVASGQQANPRIMEEIVEFLGPAGMDAIATTGYFGLGTKGHEALQSLGSKATALDVMRCVSEHMRVVEIPALRAHASLASRAGVRYITYEAGQSLVPSPPGTAPEYLGALWAAQKTPEMYRAYREMLSSLKGMNIDLFMAFVLVSAQQTRYGSWGHLEYLDEPLSDAPKYRALLDEMGISSGK
ncbi:MAG TPA: hypothetical protein PK314_10040 [Deltaproteobacteria bacterium]|jgi:hypothetical protein|nr:hypothetical protein [Deltaproteobacteria bacterium]